LVRLKNINVLASTLHKVGFESANVKEFPMLIECGRP